MRELLRIFTGKKVINSRGLNRAGLQVFRILVARSLYHLGRRPGINPNFKSDAELFERNGALIKENFLPKEFYEQVKREAKQAISEDIDKGKENYFGTNKKVLINILDLDELKYPGLYRLIRMEIITSLFNSATKKHLSFVKNGNVAIAQIEYLVQGDNSLEDVETQVHSDVFFNSYKAWLYLNDISTEDGPLTYFMSSRNNDFKKLLYEYKNSIKSVPDKSRRITIEEMQSRNLKETIIEVPQNTFVMADIHGYHRRLKGVEGKERLAIIFRERGTPFFNTKN